MHSPLETCLKLTQPLPGLFTILFRNVRILSRPRPFRHRLGHANHNKSKLGDLTLGVHERSGQSRAGFALGRNPFGRRWREGSELKGRRCACRQFGKVFAQLADSTDDGLVESRRLSALYQALGDAFKSVALGVASVTSTNGACWRDSCGASLLPPRFFIWWQRNERFDIQNFMILERYGSTGCR